MNHISNHDLERYYLGMMPENSSELETIEEYLLGCPECVARAEQSDAYVDAMRVALIINQQS
jgi:hypothetical protein